MPLATAWPMVLALGITLLAAGCLTNWAMSIAGAVLVPLALGGWIRELLPGRGEFEHARVPAHERPRAVVPAAVAIAPAAGFVHRMRLPEKVHPYSAGVRGGIVGGIGMAVVALAYGVVSGRGIWYTVNLLAAMLMPRFATATDAELAQFDALALVFGLVIHALVSAGAGLCYGVLLPTLPRWPVLWGGIVAPLLWTGAVYGFMGVLNPVMNRRVDWQWFIASQFVYGILAGLVVMRSEKVSVRGAGIS
ncbi:MAG: hypothetical protein HYX69_12240 [Planctomycetia bacterium]|nr:hypothetical protein [Planctomycetia bacterium]